MFLLDVNVLIALLDSGHPNHGPAKDFFRAHSSGGWATCPITENAVLRIFGHSAYPGGPGSPNDARHLLSSLTSVTGHQFWPDEPSLLNARVFPCLPASKHLTDVYLLALAVCRKARFATFDRNMDAGAVPGGSAAYHLIG